MTDYWVIVFDMIGSRKIVDREGAQQAYFWLCDEFNKNEEDYIVSKFTVVRGDEAIGVVSSSNAVERIVEFANRWFGFCELRVGIGVGELGNEKMPEYAVGLYGPALDIAFTNMVPTYKCLRNK